jgi:hypothetical protein
MYAQDKENWAKQVLRDRMEANTRQRPKSAVPFKNVDHDFKTKSRSFVDILNNGDSNTRVTPTFTSHVMPVDIPTHPVQNGAPGNKWQVDKSEVIHEKQKTRDSKKQADMYKMYMGLNDTPFQRYFKEHYGTQATPSTVTNVKKQRDNLGQTIGFHQHSAKTNNASVLDAKGRRAKEMDSCVWGDQGNYKNYEGKHLTQVEKNDVSHQSACFGRESSRKHDNKDRKIDTKKSTRDNLSSSVLPMKEYAAPHRDQVPSLYDDEHEIQYRKEFANKTKSKGKQRMVATNANWNDARTEGLSSFGGQGNNTNLMTLLNKSQNFKDPRAQMTQSFDVTRGFDSYASMPGNVVDPYNYHEKKNNVNLCNLRKQQNNTSQLATNNHYEKFINKKLTEVGSPTRGTMMQSNNLSHKDLKQKFLQGQEDRYMFGSADKNASGKNNKHHTAVGVHTLELDHIPANVTIDDLKRSLESNHLIGVEVDTNNLTNTSTGKGKISFRVNTDNGKQLIQDRLHQLGIQTNDYERKNKQKASKVETTAVRFLDSRNEIDLSKGKKDEYIQVANLNKSMAVPASVKKGVKKITGKVGENMLLKPKNYAQEFNNSSKNKRTAFYESTSDLFGNTNGDFSKLHNERLAVERNEMDLSSKDNRNQHMLSQGE